MKLCTFIGLEQVKNKEKVKKEVEQAVVKLLNDGVTTFLFGSGEFADLCYNVVSDLKDTYSYIERINYPCANDVLYVNEEENAKLYKQKEFEKTERINFGSLQPEKLRDRRLVDECDVCVLYAIANYIGKNDSVLDYQPSYELDPEFPINLTKRTIIIRA